MILKGVYYDRIQWIVTALVVRMDTISINYLPKQVSINFEYDGQKYNILSTKRLFIQHRNYDFLKYVNKKILIRYSLKYNIVMVVDEGKY